MAVGVKGFARSAIFCFFVGTCLAQFQQRQSNPFFNQQQQTQPRSNSFDQHQVRLNQQQARFNQRQPTLNTHDQRYIQPQQQVRNLVQSGASCPESNGRFPVASQCDAYIECVDGVGEEKLCPEGLLFNPEARFNYPCGYPIDVQCQGRSALQPAQPTEDCPHQYGYFKVGDRQNCGQFKNCVEGRAFVFDCPEGLAYNPESYRCDWPDQVADCDAEVYLGFTCPTSNQNTFLSSEARFYRSPRDCQRYYVCVEGRPRLHNCGEGHAFNELINTCDAAENVTGCEPPEFVNKNTQSIQLEEPQQNLRSFQNQQQNVRNFNQQQNSFNQQQNFKTNSGNPFFQQQGRSLNSLRNDPGTQSYYRSNQRSQFRQNIPAF